MWCWGFARRSLSHDPSSAALLPPPVGWPHLAALVASPLEAGEAGPGAMLSAKDSNLGLLVQSPASCRWTSGDGCLAQGSNLRLPGFNRVSIPAGPARHRRWVATLCPALTWPPATFRFSSGPLGSNQACRGDGVTARLHHQVREPGACRAGPRGCPPQVLDRCRQPSGWGVSRCLSRSRVATGAAADPPSLGALEQGGWHGQRGSNPPSPGWSRAARPLVSEMSSRVGGVETMSTRAVSRAQLDRGSRECSRTVRAEVAGLEPARTVVNDHPLCRLSYTSRCDPFPCGCPPTEVEERAP